jgi:phosphoribosylformimino-5-aminoimidazole carboxamide ribotide isomerase
LLSAAGKKVPDVWIYDFLEKWVDTGIQYVISTDVAKDGLLQGPSFDLYRNLQDRFPDLNIIASGGVSNMSDIEMLADMDVYAVIIGKAIYEGHVTLKELMKFSGQ